MNIRKVTSLTMLLSFIALIITSVILYIVPHGRVAYWTDWRLFGLTKTEWGNLHVNLGFLFLLAGFLHLFYNWSLIMSYMKNRARELKVFTPAFSLAFSLTLLVGAGTYLDIPPMSSVTEFGSSIKDAASRKYGEPPYGHAELSSLKLFAGKLNLNLERAEELLQTAGIHFTDSSETLAQIATKNRISPQELYQIIKPAVIRGSGQKNRFPDTPMPGFGNKTLAEICQEFELMFPVIRQALAAKKIAAGAGMTVKEIAAANDKEPMDIFTIIHETANGSQDR